MKLFPTYEALPGEDVKQSKSNRLLGASRGVLASSCSKSTRAHRTGSNTIPPCWLCMMLSGIPTTNSICTSGVSGNDDACLVSANSANAPPTGAWNEQYRVRRHFSPAVRLRQTPSIRPGNNSIRLAAPPRIWRGTSSKGGRARMRPGELSGRRASRSTTPRRRAVMSVSFPPPPSRAMVWSRRRRTRGDAAGGGRTCRTRTAAGRTCWPQSCTCLAPLTADTQTPPAPDPAPGGRTPCTRRWSRRCPARRRSPAASQRLS